MAKKIKATEILRWMQQHLSEYQDDKTDEINLTELAEAACDQFNLYDGDDCPESVFELAFAAVYGTGQ